MQILASQGHHALKMSSLCKELGVTTGSFYNYFGNWAKFIPALLTHWEEERTRRIVELSTHPANPTERVHLMKELVIAIPHDAEAAIRAWSNGDPVVAEFQRRVDAGRLQALRWVISAVVQNPERADLLSSMGMTLLIGTQSWRSPVDTEELRRLFDEFEVLIGNGADTTAHR
ncbi:TetR/AcrR family transcriptional regulator [Nocardia sp. NPDC059246]|uniref:TetR/AcrR family transcriptional regulator n=1 Tax=unclassified Nocardia TaxID=2637762 RepID=UPI0036AFF824